MSVRSRMPVVLLVALALMAALLTAFGSVPAAHSATAVRPAMFGAVGPTKQLVLTHEQALGKRMPGLRVYKKWDSTLFNADQYWARDTGHTLFVSIDSQRESKLHIKWRDIANARPGSSLYADMQRQASQIKAFRAKVYVIYNHEPEATESSTRGTPSEFVAAWRKLVDVYRAAGVTNGE